MVVDESVDRLISRVEEITGEEYSIYWRDAENIDGYISVDELLNMIKDLVFEMDRKIEEIEKLKEPVEEEYDPHDKWMEWKLGGLV